MRAELWFLLILASSAVAQTDFSVPERIGEAWIGVPDDDVQYNDIFFPGDVAHGISPLRVSTPGLPHILIEFPDVSRLATANVGGIATAQPPWILYFRFYDEAVGGFHIQWNHDRDLFYRGFYARRPILMIAARLATSSSPLVITYDPPPIKNLTKFSYLLGYDRVTGELRPIRPFTVRVTPRHPYVVMTGYYRNYRFAVHFSTPVRACNLTTNGDYAIDIGFLNIGQPGHSSNFRSRCTSPSMTGWNTNSKTNYSRTWWCQVTSTTAALPSMSFPDVFADRNYSAVCDEYDRVLKRGVWGSTAHMSTCSNVLERPMVYATRPGDPMSEYYMFWSPNMPLVPSYFAANWPMYLNRIHSDDDWMMRFNYTTQTRALPDSAANLLIHSGMGLSAPGYGCINWNGISMYVWFDPSLREDYTIDLLAGTGTFTVRFGHNAQISSPAKRSQLRTELLGCFEPGREVFIIQRHPASNGWWTSVWFDLNTLYSLYNMTCGLVPRETAMINRYMRSWQVPYKFPSSTLQIESVIAYYQDRFVLLKATDALWARSIDKWQIRDGCNRTARAAYATSPSSNTSILIEFEPGCSNFSVVMSSRAVHSYTSGFVGYSAQLATFPDKNVTLSASFDCDVRSAASISFSPSLSSPLSLIFNCSDTLVSVPVTDWVFDATPVYSCLLDLGINEIYHVYPDNHPEPIVISDHCVNPVNATCLSYQGDLLLTLDPPFTGDKLNFSCPEGERTRPYSDSKVSIAGLYECILNFTKNGISTAVPLRVSDYCPIIYGLQGSSGVDNGDTGGSGSDPVYIFINGENRTIYINGTEYVYGWNQTITVDPDIDYFDLPWLQMVGIPVLFSIAFLLLGMAVYSLYARTLSVGHAADSSPAPHHFLPSNGSTTVNVYTSQPPPSVPFENNGLPFANAVPPSYPSAFGQDPYYH